MSSSRRIPKTQGLLWVDYRASEQETISGYDGSRINGILQRAAQLKRRRQCAARAHGRIVDRSDAKGGSA